MPETASIGLSPAAAYLRELLARPGRYRELWMRRAEKPREGEISQAAVARVIADYLLINSGATAEYRRLKDRVHRALRGQKLTPDTLAWFVHAFALSEEDTRQLWSLFTGNKPDEMADVIKKLAPPPANAAALRPAEVDIVKLLEDYRLDGDGRPAIHLACHVAQAKVNGVSQVPVRSDTNAMTVEVARGGTPTAIYHCDTGYAFDVVLDSPLRVDQFAYIEYVVTFTAAAPNKRYFRRAAARLIRDITITVRFDPHKLPQQIWWSTWQDPAPDSEPTVREPVALDEDGSASKHLASAERTIIGFAWEW